MSPSEDDTLLNPSYPDFTLPPTDPPLPHECVGDPLVCRQSDHTRLFFGNINGFQFRDNGSALAPALHAFTSLEADVVCLSEHNVDSCQAPVRTRVHEAVRSVFEHSSLSISSSPISFATPYKRGGTFSLVVSDMVGRLVQSGRDRLGRWSYQIFQGKANRRIAVVSAYQVCVPSGANHHGVLTESAWSQQVSALRSEGVTPADPRASFSTDLLDFLTTCVTDGCELIIGGDFNTDFDETNSVLRTLCTDPSINVCDPIGLMYPRANITPTHQSGSRRIDHLLVSHSLYPYIRKCALLPFDFAVDSDHRFTYIDFDTSGLFGDVAALAPLPMRDIKSSDPANVNKYLLHLDSYLEHNNFWNLLNDLESTTTPDHLLAERLDKIMVQGSLSAGAKCRVNRRNWWSTTLAKAEERVRLLNLIHSKMKRRRRVSDVFHASLSVLDEAYTPPSTLQDLRKLLSAAQSHRRAIRRDSRCVRDRYIEQLIQTAEANGRTHLVKRYKNLLRQELQNRQWSRLHHLSEARSRGLTSIDVPSDWKTKTDPRLFSNPKRDKDILEWITLNVPEDVEKYIRLRNLLHFGQAQGTPFTVEPLSYRVNWSASTIEAEQILDGDFTDEDLEFLQQQILLQCRSEIINAPTDAPLITVEQWKGRIKNWNERTTTSPSGVHLGHAKVLLAPILAPPKDLSYKYMTDIQDRLIRAHVILLNYASRFGYSFDRWRDITNVMIEKKPGNHRIHRLRVIHIYEHDFGLYLAHHWKNMLHSAEQRHTINAGQYGGRKGRDSQSLVFLEELKTEICHFSRSSLVNFDNDAASCYDRIIPNLASLIGRSKGIHRHVAIVHATTLEEARFKLKTALGVSADHYSPSEEFPLFGTGQGSTNSPMIWILVSSVLFDLHSDHAHGATFSSPDGRTVIQFSIVGFVDDSNCNTNRFLAPNPTDLPSLLAAATRDAQLWSDLLWLSGGYLELSKCSFHLIHFEFTSNGSPRLRPTVPGTITIIDAQTRLPVPVPSKSNRDFHRTLGHNKAPYDERAQLDELSSISKTFSDRLARFRLHSDDASLYYHHVYIPQMQYILPQCSILPTTLDHKCNSAVLAFSRAGGYAQSTHLSIRYGPKSLGGAGFFKASTQWFKSHQKRNFLRHH